MLPDLKLGEDIRHGEFNLIPVKVDIWNNLVFACLSQESEPLAKWFGEIVELTKDYPTVSQMSFEAKRSNTCQSNWKCYSDNSAEGYHLATIHPELNHSLVKDATNITSYEDGKFVGFDVTYKENGQQSSGYWVYKFPGLLMHFSERSFNIEKVTPVNAQQTRLDRWFWFLPEVSQAERDEIIGFSNQVMKEDIDICERVQQNLEAGYYQQGILSQAREPGTIFFQQCVRSALHLSSQLEPELRLS